MGLAAAFVVAGVLVAAGGLLPFLETESLGNATNDSVVAFGLRGLMLAAVGLMIGAGSVSRPVVVGSVFGVSAMTLVSLLSYASIWFNDDDAGPGAGWWLGVLGSVLAVGLGVLHAVRAPLRAPLRLRRVPWRDSTVWVALVVAMASLGSCIGLGGYIESAGGATFWGIVTLVWGLFVVGATVAAIALVPVASGRAVMCTAGVGLLSQGLATAMVVAANGGETSNGVAVAVFAVALVGAGSVLGWGRSAASARAP